MIGQCHARHRADEFRSFLDEIEANVPDGLSIHLVMDNYATHKTDAIRRWLAKRPHWHVHFTPTSASWINQVERFFALLTNRKIRRGSYTSTTQLEDDILAAIKRFSDRTQKIGRSLEAGYYRQPQKPPPKMPGCDCGW